MTIFSGMLKANNQKLLVCFSFIALSLLSIGCEEEAFEETVVLTENVLFVSGERAVFTGRFLSGGNLALEDHGFLIDTDESFSSPITISLGERTKPGLFTGETDQLVNETNYWCKSFIQHAGEKVFGSAVPFSTLAAIIIDYQPTLAFSGQSIEIDGGNFTQDTKVFFGDQPAVIEQNLQESKLRVRIPPVGDEYIVPITVVVQGDTLVFSTPFEYVIGKWNLEGIFVNEQDYNGAVFFRDGDRLVFGLGWENNRFHNRLWSMDLSSLTWTELPYTGIPVFRGFAAAPFFGSGRYRLPDFPGDPDTYGDQFWKHENGSVSAVGTTPFRLQGTVSFSYDQMIYVLGGSDVLEENNRVMYRYDAALDQWANLGATSFDISSEYPFFQRGEEFFVIDADGLVHRYRVPDASWEIISSFPDIIRTNGVSVVLGNKAYLGVFQNTSALWEFDLITYQWKRKNNFLGDVLENNAAYWTYQDRLFVMRNRERSNQPMEIWSFSPDEF